MALGGTLNRVTLTQQIADSIEASIIADNMYHEKLPSEQILCEKFKVSRTIIREALRILNARGLVQSRTGGGSFVTKPSASDISSLLLRVIRMDKISDEEVYQMRLILEVSAVKDVVRRITEEEMQILSDQVDSMERSMFDIPVRMEKDIEFHIMLGKFSGNRLLALMTESMVDVLRDFIERGIKVAGGNEDGVYRHRVILEALKSGDPKIAEKAMIEHLEHSFANVRAQQNP